MEEVQTDIALFCRGELLAILALAVTDNGGAIMRLDPRNEKPEVALFDNYFSAVASFDNSIETSIKRGWTCFHKGKPNYG